MDANRKLPGPRVPNPTAEGEVASLSGTTSGVREAPSTALALIVAGANVQCGGLSLLTSPVPWLIVLGVLLANLGFGVAALGGMALARPRTGMARYAPPLLILACALGTITIDIALLERL